MTKIILKPFATSHQKFLLYSFFIAFFFIGLGTIAWYIAYFMGKPVTVEPYTTTDLIVLLFFLLSFVLLGIALCKEGLMLDEKRLFKSIFLFKKPIKSSPINLDDYTDVSVLGYNMNQKYAFGASPNPDQSVDYREYRIYLLNSRHSKKHLVASIKDSAMANDTARQLVENLGLTNSRYNPPISKKSRMKRR